MPSQYNIFRFVPSRLVLVEVEMENEQCWIVSIDLKILDEKRPICVEVEERGRIGCLVVVWTWLFTLLCSRSRDCLFRYRVSFFLWIFEGMGGGRKEGKKDIPRETTGWGTSWGAALVVGDMTGWKDLPLFFWSWESLSGFGVCGYDF